MIQQMLAMWSLVPLPFLKPAWTSGNSWFTKPVNQKHIDCQTFLRQRWVHSGFAENYNLRSSTLQIPTRQREENAFIEKKRKLGVGERPWTQYVAFHWLNPVKNGSKGAFLFLIGLCSCDSVWVPPSGLFHWDFCLSIFYKCFIKLKTTLDFPGGSDSKVSACNAGDLGSISGQEDLLRRKWQSTPVFLPGKSRWWRSLVGYSPWGCKESDTTEWLHFPLFKLNNHRFTHVSGYAFKMFKLLDLPILHWPLQY